MSELLEWLYDQGENSMTIEEMLRDFDVSENEKIDGCWVINICFYNQQDQKQDQTQFEVESIVDQIELTDLWEQFCKETNVRVDSIIYMELAK